MKKPQAADRVVTRPLSILRSPPELHHFFCSASSRAAIRVYMTTVLDSSLCYDILIRSTSPVWTFVTPGMATKQRFLHQSAKWRTLVGPDRKRRKNRGCFEIKPYVASIF